MDFYWLGLGLVVFTFSSSFAPSTNHQPSTSTRLIHTSIINHLQSSLDFLILILSINGEEREDIIEVSKPQPKASIIPHDLREQLFTRL